MFFVFILDYFSLVDKLEYISEGKKRRKSIVFLPCFAKTRSFTESVTLDLGIEEGFVDGYNLACLRQFMGDNTL